MSDLLYAAFHGDVARMMQLLAEGANIAEVDDNGIGVVISAALGNKLVALSWLLVECEANINEVGNGCCYTVWTCLRPQHPDDAELSSLLKVMVMLDDAPAHFISRCLLLHAELCEQGCQFRAQLPFYLELQEATIVKKCPLPAVLQSLVFAYAATTTEDVWADGLRVFAP
jgi:hypothetical protein